jgi:hypothetical protein
MELCLFADRRASITRSFLSVLEMTRYVFHYARHTEATDFLIAAPLDHVAFYARYFAFERVAGRLDTPVVHGQHTNLLRLKIPERLAQQPPPAEVDYYMERPVPAEAYERRFRFSGDSGTGILPVSPVSQACSEELARFVA